MSSFPKRDNANELPSPENIQPRSASLSTRLARSEKPLFVGRHNRAPRPITFGKSTKDGEELAQRPSSGGWMSGKGSSIGLAEAFKRTDENGNFMPKQRPSPRQGAVGAVSDSRIPRSRTYSPSAHPSPPAKFDEGYKLSGRQERLASMPLDSESDTGTRDGSPSPAPKDRRWSQDENGSDASQISLVEDPTLDDFDKKVSQHARDQRRMKKILANQTPIFLRGDVGPKVAETTRTLVRKTSESSIEAEPPIRPPRTWGSKARRNDGWMQKIMSPDTSFELKDALKDQALLQRQPAEADAPLSSIEDMSSIQNMTPPASRPASAQPKNGSPEKSQMWNADLDFTAQSLQISTSPQLRMKPAKLDEIRDREIQTLTARAVATNRLEEIRERNSEDRSLNQEAIQQESKELPPKASKTSEPPVIEDSHEMTILEEEGEHIQGTPITIFTKAAYESRIRSNSSSRERTLNQGSAGRSNHSRDDSRELLRRLSRTASHSPAPSRTVDEIGEKIAKSSSQERAQANEAPKKVNTAADKPEKYSSKPDEKPVKHDSAGTKAETRSESSSRSRSTGLELDVKRYSAASTPPKSDVDPEERITAEARLFDLQDNRSERNSIRAPSRSPSPAPEDGQFDETPRPKQRVDPLSLPTPKVTGAYIETPAPTVRKPRKSRSISPDYEVVNATDGVSPSGSKPAQEGATVASDPLPRDRPRRHLQRTTSQRELGTEVKTTTSRPPLINTATPASAAEDLRRIQQEAQLEDSTLGDFDALLEAEAASAVDTQDNTTIFEPILDLEYDERGLPLSKKAIERRIEQLQLDRMSQSIKNTSSSIRDARHGIERLAEQVSSAVPSIEKSDGPVYIKVKLPVPRLWISHPPPKPGMKPRWKFTWLGLFITIFTSWYISETAMCSQFCHPVNSMYNTWQLSDPFFPWAIPTKLDQWTGEVVSTTASEVWDSLGGWKPPKKKYKSGPLGASDWWEGRSGPVGLQFDDERDGMNSIFMDEMMDDS